MMFFAKACFFFVRVADDMWVADIINVCSKRAVGTQCGHSFVIAHCVPTMMHSCCTVVKLFF